MTPLLLNLRIAVSALRHAWRRNLLALTGLAVGIAAVVAMLGLTLIVRQEALRQFDRSGLDVLAIRKTSTTSPSTARRPPQIEAATLRHLAAAVPALDLIAPLMERRGTLGFNGRTSQATVLGVTESFLELNALEAAEGRLLTDLDHAEPYVVIGRDLAGNLRGGVGTPLIGRQLQVEGRVLTIVGVLAPAVLLVANGDLRQSANEVCWPAQHAMEQTLAAAVAKLGTNSSAPIPTSPRSSTASSVRRRKAWRSSPDRSQRAAHRRRGRLAVFPPRAAGLISHRGPDPHRRQLERHLAGASSAC
jgi:hypothetical protein